jgi:hypothetical protein
MHAIYYVDKQLSYVLRRTFCSFIYELHAKNDMNH